MGNLETVFDQFGLAEAVRPKTVLMPGALTDFAAETSDDKVDIAIIQPMEIPATTDHALAGRLPPALQDKEAFTWAVVSAKRRLRPMWRPP